MTPLQQQAKAYLDAHDEAGFNSLPLTDADIAAVHQAGIQTKGQDAQPWPEVSAGRAGALGMSQGASLGAADELASEIVPALANKNAVTMTPAALAYWKKVNPADAAHAEWINQQYAVTPERVQAKQDAELGLAKQQQPLPYGAGYVAGAAPAMIAAGASVPAQVALGGVAGAMSAGPEDRLAGGLLGASTSALGAKVGGRLAPQAETFDTVANSVSRGLMDIPPEEAVRMGTSGQMPGVVGAVRQNLGPGGRLGIAERLSAQNQPVGGELEDLLAAIEKTGQTVDTATLADAVGEKAHGYELGGTFSQGSEAAPGMRYYEKFLRRQSTDQPATGAPRSALDVWEERKALDQAADFGGRPGQPNNPDLARAEIRPVIDDQLHGMVGEAGGPEELQRLLDLEGQYHATATAKKYMLDSATKVGSQGGAGADAISALSGMGEAKGRSMLSSMSKPARESLAINIGRVADYAAKKLGVVGQKRLDQAGAGLGSAVGGAALNSKLQELLQSVANSPDAQMEDYLYREMYPEYGAAMIAAEDEMKKAPPETEQINTMTDSMRKLQGQ